MDSVLLDLGFFQIKWYSICIILAVFIPSFFIIKEAKKFKINKDLIFNLLFWTIIFGIIGARIYFVIFNFEHYKTEPAEIFKIWHGGLAIHGGIIAGIITIFAFCKKYKIRLLRMLDIIAPWVLLAQAIGRWGNFFNGEAYGTATTLKDLQTLPIPDFVIDNMLINGTYYTPTFFYESIFCLIGFVLLILIKIFPRIKIGMITSFYLIWYGIIRFFIESLRTDSLMIGDFKVAQIMSAILVLTGIILFITRLNKPRFEDRYNDPTDLADMKY